MHGLSSRCPGWYQRQPDLPPTAHRAIRPTMMYGHRPAALPARSPRTLLVGAGQCVAPFVERQGHLLVGSGSEFSKNPSPRVNRVTCGEMTAWLTAEQPASMRLPSATDHRDPLGVDPRSWPAAPRTVRLRARAGFRSSDFSAWSTRRPHGGFLCSANAQRSVTASRSDSRRGSP